MFSTFLPFIEDAGNRVLRLDPETLQRLGDLQGRTICIEFTDLGRQLFLDPSESGFRMFDEYSGTPAVTLRGKMITFVRLGLDPERTGPAPGDLEIRGDAALGQKMQKILQDIDLDWEEPLARMLGDPAGHAVARSLRAIHHWHVQALKTLGANVAEYLQEEARIVPVRFEVDAFLDAVDVLRDDVDRLESRVLRLAAGGRRA